jgi:hypothetical protein
MAMVARLRGMTSDTIGVAPPASTLEKKVFIYHGKKYGGRATFRGY